MKIFLPKNSLLNVLFPQIEDYAKLSDSDLSHIKKAYSFGSHEPEVVVKEHGIEIIFDELEVQRSHEALKELVTLSENHNYEQALKKADVLIAENPAKNIKALKHTSL